MANFPVFHGITVAANAHIENLTIESLASDPIGAAEGRVWYNAVEKSFKAAVTDDSGSLSIIAFQDASDFSSFLIDLASQAVGDSGAKKVGYEGKAGANGLFSAAPGTLDSIIGSIIEAIDAEKLLSKDLESSDAGKGVNAIGYEGKAGQNNKFSVVPGTVKSALDMMIDQIDANSEASSVSSQGIQDELDNTQSAAGLSATGDYSAPATSNYLKQSDFVANSKTASLASADELLDAQIKTLSDQVTSNSSDVTSALATVVKKAGDTMSGPLNMGGNPILSTAVPTDPAHLVNLKYIDGMRAGLDVKDSVRVATSAEITNLAGDTQANGDNTYSIDGVALKSGDRVLVKDGASIDGVEAATYTSNGIYTVDITTDLPEVGSATAIFTRADDADGSPVSEVTNGMHTFIEEGQKYANAGFVLSTPNPITVNTTELTFAQFSGAGQLTAGAGIQKDGNNIYLNFGAGVKESPLDEIGIDVGAGLFTTEDGTASSDATSAKLEIKLDGTTLSKGPDGLKVSSSFADQITTLQTELDLSQTSSGLDNSGNYIADSSAHYISSAVSLHNATQQLDAQVKGTSDKIDLEVVKVNDAITTVSDELNTTQVGAGLSTNGNYETPVTANYLTASTSLHDATIELDKQLKGVADTVAQEITDRESADNAIKLGAGLLANGNMPDVSAAKYIASATNMFDAVTSLDQSLNQNITRVNTDISSVVTQLNAQKHAFQSDQPNLEHRIQHNLGAAMVDVTVWVKRSDDKFYNDIALVKEETNNEIVVYLSEAAHVKVAIEAIADINAPAA